MKAFLLLLALILTSCTTLPLHDFKGDFNPEFLTSYQISVCNKFKFAAPVNRGKLGRKILRILPSSSITHSANSHVNQYPFRMTVQDVINLLGIPNSQTAETLAYTISDITSDRDAFKFRKNFETLLFFISDGHVVDLKLTTKTSSIPAIRELSDLTLNLLNCVSAQNFDCLENKISEKISFVINGRIRNVSRSAVIELLKYGREQGMYLPSRQIDKIYLSEDGAKAWGNVNAQIEYFSEKRPVRKRTKAGSLWLVFERVERNWKLFSFIDSFGIVIRDSSRWQ